MGVDARLAIKFKQEPTIEKVKELQYHLLQRFDNDLFIWSFEKDKPKKDFITKIEDGEYHFDTETNVTGYWDVNLTCRYYGEGYERGPGLQIAAVLMFLSLREEIEEVRYGGDSSGTEGEIYTYDKALELLNLYLTVANSPYQRYFDREKIPHPSCTFCLQPMLQYGFGGRFAAFSCEGCREQIQFKDEVYDKWMKQVEASKL